MSGPHGITRVEIVVPGTPPACLSPNASRETHWGTKAKARTRLKDDATRAAVAVRNTCGGGPLFDGPVLVRITIGWEKGRKTMDGDNALASCKAAIDGLTAAGIWRDDRDCTFLPVGQERDPDKRGYIRFEVEEVTA